MAAPLPFTLALPATYEIRLVLRRFSFYDSETHRLVGHVYSNLLVYPMDAKFFAMGYGRVRQYLHDRSIPDRISLSRDVVHIMKNKDDGSALTGNNCLSIQITGAALGHLDERLIQDLFAQFYANPSLLISCK